MGKPKLSKREQQRIRTTLQRHGKDFFVKAGKKGGNPILLKQKKEK